MKNSNKAFTLLEVMIFTAILSIVLVSTAAFVSRLIYNLKINEHKIYANLYATEIQEWLSSERESSWPNLLSKASTSGSTYCLNSNIGYNYTTASMPAAGACSGFTGITGIATQPQIYKRELTLTSNASGTTIDAVITVSWNEGSKLYTERIESLYTSY